MSAPFAHLTQSLILDASEAFGLEPNFSLYPLNSYENRVYYVGIEQNTPVVCKIYHFIDGLLNKLKKSSVLLKERQTNSSHCPSNEQ